MSRLLRWHLYGHPHTVTQLQRSLLCVNFMVVKDVLSPQIQIPRYGLTQWVALESSEPQLRWMLERNLRQDRYPRHAGKVRARNMIDLLAKTLQFERQVKEWRLAELRAGLGDPGRPPHEYAFLTETHRHLTAGIRVYIIAPFIAAISVYSAQNNALESTPTHTNPFPVVDTLLSIPFSLQTSSPFRNDLANMALEVVSLWTWDPVPAPMNTPIQSNSTRSQPPLPIFHPSRNATFESMRPTSFAPSYAEAAAAAIPGERRAESGEYIVGTPPRVYLHNGALTTVPPDFDVDGEKQKIFPTHSTAPSWHSSAFQCGSTETETALSNSDVLSKLDVVSLQARIATCLENTDNDMLNPLPDVNDTGSFIPGVIGGMSTNDMLMVKGLFNPSVYVQFYNLGLCT